MRNLKFRIWCKQTETMHFVSKMSFTDGELWYAEDEDHETQPPYFVGDDDWELMQYTGLKDANGKEIYEGDIVKYLDRNLEHAFGGRGEAWEVKIKEIKWSEITYSWLVPMGFSKEIEVIGNIYENKSLLEGESND